MNKSIFRIFVNLILVFAGYNIYRKIYQSLNQWEREPELILGRKQSENEEMIYDIYKVIDKNEPLMKKFDALRVSNPHLQIENIIFQNIQIKPRARMHSLQARSYMQIIIMRRMRVLR